LPIFAAWMIPESFELKICISCSQLAYLSLCVYATDPAFDQLVQFATNHYITMGGSLLEISYVINGCLSKFGGLCRISYGPPRLHK